MTDRKAEAKATSAKELAKQLKEATPYWGQRKPVPGSMVEKMGIRSAYDYTMIQINALEDVVSALEEASATTERVLEELRDDYIKLAKRWKQEIKKDFPEEVLELIESYLPAEIKAKASESKETDWSDDGNWP